MPSLNHKPKERDDRTTPDSSRGILARGHQGEHLLQTRGRARLLRVRIYPSSPNHLFGTKPIRLQPGFASIHGT